MGLKLGESDESKVPPGPLAFWCLGEVEEPKHQTIRQLKEHKRMTRTLYIVCLAPKHVCFQEGKKTISLQSLALMDNNVFS